MICRGWTIRDWQVFHSNADPERSFDLLSKLLESQALSNNDPAWISLASIQHLTNQWDLLQYTKKYSSVPLYGVPIAIKDNIDVYGLKTTAGCSSFAYEPSENATVIKCLKNAGAIILGKTNMDQFATGLVGTRSPYGIIPNTFNDKYIVGGSSSGSASVVARGIVPIALGTDTAGSGRIPAAFNNLIGLKPTRGVFSCKGVVPACKSLDCVSIFSLNIQDAQLVFNIIAHGYPNVSDDGDEYLRPMPDNIILNFPLSPNVAVPSNLLWFDENENPDLYDGAIRIFEELGSKLVPLDIEPLLELSKHLYEGPWVSERYLATKNFFAKNPPRESLDLIVKSIINSGKHNSCALFFEYEYKRQRILRKVKKLLKEIDVIIVPTAPFNPTIEQVIQSPIEINSHLGTYTNFVNLADMSALAIPAGFRSNGLPFGITLLSSKFNDYALLELASRYFEVYTKKVPRFYGCMDDRIVSSIRDEMLNLSIPILNTKSLINFAVVGAHLNNTQLRWQLYKCNALFLKFAETSQNYKLYALPNTDSVSKPGLRRVNSNGDKITVEIYFISKESFCDFILTVHEPLGIGSVELESGEWVNLLIREEFRYNLPGTVEITEVGDLKDFQQKFEIENDEVKKPFNSVLIANRGEIAVRIIKTLKRIGIKSIAVYSDLDKYAKHVEIADVAIPLHGVSAAETYISIEKIIKAAKNSGAEAIIPGYGFLAENADFSDLCSQEGIVFVGPSGDTIRKLGLKHSAREIASKANIPLIPGSGLIKDVEEAKAFASKIKYPIMVKSTAGGGGIGLQKVDTENDMEKVFNTVQHQSESYFKGSGVFLEKFIENARHVEIQIFGDGNGNAIALGDRDCSLQRRNQKIIEETPAPNINELTKIKMRKAAESLVVLTEYKGAGTVEFIYDEINDNFYFLEVNTRLQVEHPITEMVTGLDLVEWMLLIAADIPPNLNQEIKITGASMEARLYAENPLKGFTPSPGKITKIEFPKWARIDGWVKKGTIISSEYDPTLAKIIVYGENRYNAWRNLCKALDGTVVYGCITNIDYLRSIAKSAMFQEARVSTKALDSYNYEPHAFEILRPGTFTTIQDYPGRIGYWSKGVPPSGCMDVYSFRLANRIVGNDKAAPGIEITLDGPKLLFLDDSVIAITGGDVNVDINGKLMKQWSPIHIKKGDTLSIGKLSSGCRAYLAIRGGIDVAEYLGSRSTFALGNIGGYNGRILKSGDVLFMGQPELVSSTLPKPISEPTEVPISLIPSFKKNFWTVGVMCGPHSSPDFFKPEYIEKFFSETWKVHYNSNRLGVRLIGPKPEWARTDGGEAGLHPSNTHDYAYSLGAVNFTGDEPVILTCDGPSLGGFVCAAVVVEAEMWKVGQVKPGDTIKFFPICYTHAKVLKFHQDKIIELLKGYVPRINNMKFNSEDPILYNYMFSSSVPEAIYRQAGDRYILVEYGDVLDFNLTYRIHKLSEMIMEDRAAGFVEASPGVRSILIEFNDNILPEMVLKLLVKYESKIPFVDKWKVESKIIKLPMAFEDNKTLECVKRYQETIRSNAPWLPNNVNFIARINRISRKDVKKMLYSARFLVLGLGDVYSGAPCAVPLDPRHRLLGTKYNPSRTFTPNGTVGIGGNYMCIYTMESPGGYQLVGRTIPIWDKLSLGAHSTTDRQWLLSIFDQIEFYPVSEDELDKFTEEMEHGRFKIDITESVFNHATYLEYIQSNSKSIQDFKNDQFDKKLEFIKLIQISNKELEKPSVKLTEEEKFDESVEIVYAEYSGKFWKSLINIGDIVDKNQGLVVVESMKTEIVVNALRGGKVLKIFHKNGDPVDAGDPVVIIE